MKIPLTEWASRNYDPPPSAWVLRKWARAGQITPAPERVGAAYYVDDTARRQLNPRPSLVERLKTA